jgi:hypothetical protein
MAKRKQIAARLPAEMADFLKDHGVTETLEAALKIYMCCHDRAARQRAKMARIKKTGRMRNEQAGSNY